ncbi:endonuclease domain-containing protein [Polluticoccus soli]|uniref:endonuclease domain-containing protein n=1 Tax=Polluticoccus soli TaxID=3034150 RepID=UPI0023E2B1C2|nr:DUF559 domain-containing protein [Flavipsychrobacter sp. JY13-12]
MQLHNRSDLKALRKNLRNNATQGEKELWKLLRGSGLEGKKFRRQHSVGGYILDFYCPSERLCIELDGEAHFTEEGRTHDEKRTKFLEENFITVLRFESGLVMQFPEEVLATIKAIFRAK